MDNIV